MKVIIINNLYSPWVRGGAERIAEKTAAGLEKAGHEVFIIATAPVGSRTDCVCYLPSIFYYLDKYPLWQRFFWHLGDIFNFASAGKIRKILEEKKPDLVITHNLQGIGLLAPGLLRKMKIRHFHTLHDIQLLHPSGLLIWGKERAIETVAAKIYQAIARRLFGSPAVVISPSRWLLNEHSKRGFFNNSKKVVLPNFFSRDCSSPSNSNFTFQISNLKFLYVGQIEEHKGVELLVGSFLEFLENNKNSRAELAIVGSGSRLEEIKKMAQACPAIRILGRKREDEVEDLMRSADCLVVPSLCYENSPTVVYEAMAAGLPVLGAKIGGLAELIEAAGGIAFTPGDKQDLALKLAEIAKNPKQLDEIRAKRKDWQPPDYIAELARLAKD